MTVVTSSEATNSLPSRNRNPRGSARVMKGSVGGRLPRSSWWLFALLRPALCLKQAAGGAGGRRLIFGLCFLIRRFSCTPGSDRDFFRQRFGGRPLWAKQ